MAFWRAYYAYTEFRLISTNLLWLVVSHNRDWHSTQTPIGWHNTSAPHELKLEMLNEHIHFVAI